MKRGWVHAELDEIANVCNHSDSRRTHSAHDSRSANGVATFTQLASGSWGVQLRRKTRYPLFCVTLLRYLAGGFPSAFLNMVIKAVTDS
jgi:hypothetical protein